MSFSFGFSALGHYISHDIAGKFSDKAMLIISSVASPILVIIATYLHSLSAGLILASASIFFGIKNPIIEHWINDEFSSNVRATVLSISNFANELMIAICYPFVGYLADLYSINTAFLISAVLLLSVPVLFLFLKQKKIRHSSA